MKPMVWKEVREMGRWAALAMIVLGVAAALALMQTRRSLVYGDGTADVSLLPWTPYAPLVALVLGLLQILPEQRRDQWAFLIHRPATRDALFGGKALAGLGLYALAVGVPALAALTWAAMPGHLPLPFDLRLALPALADLLIGVPCYFAGLLTALRPARWYGSRALPIPAAAVGVLLAYSQPTFYQSALISLFSTLLFALAAWGSFRTTGQYARQPKASQLSLGVILYVGILVAVGALAALTASFVPDVPAPEQRDTRTLSYYEVTRAGKVLRVTRRGGKTLHAEDLQGRAVAVGKHFGDSLLEPNEDTLWYRDTPPDSGQADFRHSSRVFVLVYGTSRTTPQGMFWYYHVPERRLLGYSRQTQRLTMVAGPQGAAPADAPRPLPFPPGLRNNTAKDYGEGNNLTGSGLMVYDHVVYALNLADARLAPLLIIPPPERIDVLRQHYVPIPPNSPNPLPYPLNPDGSRVAVLEVVTPAQVRIYDPLGHLLLSMPRYLDAAQRYGDPDVHRLPRGDRYLFQYGPTRRIPRAVRRAMPSFMVTTDAHGKVLRQDTLPALFNAPFVPPPHPTYAAAWGILAPPAWFAGGLWYRTVNPLPPHDPGWMEAMWGDLRVPFHTYQNNVWMSVLCGGLSAVLAVLVGRRCAWSRAGQVAWGVGVFWLGLYGVLLLVALEAWPAQAICPRCGRRRVVTRERCEHCQSEWAAPAPDGTEIFDAPQTVAAGL